MTVLVVGASGATGRLVVRALLARGLGVRAVLRAGSALPDDLRDAEGLSVTRGTVLGMSDAEVAELVRDCRAVISCLGHNLTVRGMYGAPRKLVTDTLRRLCEAARAEAPSVPVRAVLMNTAGNSNRDLDEPVSGAQRAIVGLLRALLPPHVDNEAAADYLRLEIGQDDLALEWVAVRPDGLIDAEAVTPYDLHPSPTRSAIFDSGTTSRINVADFMAALVTDDALWERWKGRMPVIYNRA
jgi:NAD(P)-dependent dehydrogenase (short-subunit alcohol dehydrogenase family)